MEYPEKVADYEKWVLDNAVYFTTVLFRGRGQYDRLEHKTLAEARRVAATRTDSQGRKAIIYAVTACGRDAVVI